ncbi:hypothetical protein ASD81_13515 [Nocardioides sp. Root614]|nr:hypothetical protein ASD81_13515 [Nocardioides sp. Root614]KRA89210.1 hypothetical protein ASD84_13780 [Nocardioides sp. Root682]
MVDTTSLVPGSIADHASCLMLKVGQVVFRMTEQQLATLGLRTRHYSVLQALEDHGGALSQNDLGSYLRIDRATMVATLDDLESLGLAARRRDAADRRRYLVEISDKGNTTADQCRALLAALDEDVFADLSSTQRARLRTSLVTLAESESLLGATT